MRCTVLKAFPYAHDGIRLVELVEGDTPDIHDDLVPGLIKEGFVARAPETVGADVAAAEQAAREKAEVGAKLAARSEVVIPDPLPAKWEDLRALAVQLTDDQVKSKEDAHAAIDAERARRNPT